VDREISASRLNSVRDEEQTRNSLDYSHTRRVLYLCILLGSLASSLPAPASFNLS